MNPFYYRSRFLLLALLVVSAADRGVAQQQPASESPQPAKPATQAGELPPISWTCPMHPEVVEGEKGICHICKMDLVPTRLDLIYTCPIHKVIQQAKPGTCPLDRRELVQVTVALSWTCPLHGEINELEPGTCKICGRDLAVRRVGRAHGDHNPKFGGMFFMAPDNWHHLEGTYPESGVFRMYLYDDYTKPLAAPAAKGRIVTKETFDPVRKEAQELAVFPLVAAADGAILEAHVDKLNPPAQMAAKVRFEPGGPEYRFDFNFAEYSKKPDDPAAGAPMSMPFTVVVAIPEKTEDVIAELNVRNQRLQELIEKGTFSELFIPALEGKDLALALDARRTSLPPARQKAVERAVKRLVQLAWLLEGYGDQGNKAQVARVYEAFSSAVGAIKAGYASRQ